MANDDRIKALLPELINGKTHEQLMDKIAAADKVTGTHVIDGVRFPWMVQPSTFEALKTFEVRDDDVLIMSYPRSGTHWTAEIMHFILNDGRDDFDRSFMTAGLELTLAPDPSLVESTTPGYKIYEGMRSPRCMIGHCPVKHLPPQLFTKKAKVIYVARNPKDTQASILNLAKADEKNLMSGNLEENLWLFYTGQAFLGSWFDHVLSYWKHRDDDNFLFLKYEDLHKDLRGSICKLAKHVGKDLSNDVIDKIVERVTFGGMQKTYQKIEDEGGDEGKMMTRAMGTTPHLNKGKIGNWKNFFTVAQSALFDKIFALKMQGTGLEFDFEL